MATSNLIPTEQPTERVLLVGVVHPFQDVLEVEENLEELARLTLTAGGEVVGTVLQNRATIDATYYIGKGKADEIAAKVEMLQVDLVIFDDELSPAQVKNLQRLMKKARIIDRGFLILDIFARHARTREAKTQVELAHWEYLLPRLTRQWTHLERQRAIGTRGGPGETQIELDRRMIGQRISRLKKDLTKIEQQRATRRKNRQDVYKVALVGYTNAGKSSLMNLLTDAQVLVEDKLFATLDTTVRTIDLEGYNILLSDTVGFIRKLPHNLIASFKSTLQEVDDADLILKIVDINNPNYDKHLETVDTVLQELGVTERQTLTIFNKIDLIGDQEVFTAALRQFPDALAISVKTQININKLENAILDTIRSEHTIQELMLSYDQQKLLAHLHTISDVLEIEYLEESIRVKVKGRRALLDSIEK